MTEETIFQEQMMMDSYDQMLRSRNNHVRNRVKRLTTAENATRMNPEEILKDALAEALYKNPGARPSEIIRRLCPDVVQAAVFPRFQELFYEMADRILEVPCDTGWMRRSFRSEAYRSYADRLAKMFSSFLYSAVVDADICHILNGNLSANARCYLRNGRTQIAGFAPEVLAYELDRENPPLEAIVTEIVSGENGFSVVSDQLIRGMVLSHNPRMHKLLCDLLLAARLQEGLRQAICENADWGTGAAFRAILNCIVENDLIRFSSVKRAVGTWLGLISEETRDLDRISGKSLNLMISCLGDEQFRENCLASDDAMEIYIALWSVAFDSVEKAMDRVEEFARNGTHHQTLVAGYLAANLNSERMRHGIARRVLTLRRDRNDILAVYLPHLIPWQQHRAIEFSRERNKPVLEIYFTSREEAEEFCDWLMELRTGMKKKELVLEPCIFPWHKAVLKRSDMVEKAMVIATLLNDERRIDRLCPMVADCDAYTREYFFGMLSMGTKTPGVREMILKALSDKGRMTREAAVDRCRELDLTDGEYRLMEDLLRLKYDDLRRGVMELLLKQKDGPLEAAIGRLLSDPKPEKRMAALDMLTQLQKEKKRSGIVNRCLPMAAAIASPTGQEKVLISTLIPVEEETPKLMFSEADRYVPVMEMDDSARRCLEEFAELFPESRLMEQALAGKPAAPDAHREKAEPCAGAVAARQRLEQLNTYFDGLKDQEFMPDFSYEGTKPLSVEAGRFYKRVGENNELEAPRMDLWLHWLEESGVSDRELFGMYVLTSAQNHQGQKYLKKCAGYMALIFGEGFQMPVAHKWKWHLNMILRSLLMHRLGQQKLSRVAGALGIWICRCLPEEMLIGDKGLTARLGSAVHQIPEWLKTVYAGDAEGHWKIRRMAEDCGTGHFIAHPQMGRILLWLRPAERMLVPVCFGVMERSYEATRVYARTKLGLQPPKQMDHLFASLYTDSGPANWSIAKPRPEWYLVAYHTGLISELTMMYHLMEPGFLKESLEVVTAVCASYPVEGEWMPRNLSGHGYVRARFLTESFLGPNKPLNQTQQSLVELCREVEKKLLDIVADAELRRGDSPAAYSEYISGIYHLQGAQWFVRILTALEKDTFDRSVYYWGTVKNRRGNLSHLLSRCQPGPEDSAQTLGELLKGRKITERRLIEAALYSPTWIDIIGDHLKQPGFKSACYYFMAHMNEQFDEQKKAVIARYTPLEEEELNQGAFDVEWFRSAYDQLGEKRFDMLYDAAKYISDGSKHTRARKYADAALGKFDVEQTEQAIRDKRNKDLLMAYAIIPLTGEEDLIRRYLFLQQFLKESRQFGAQRSASEKKAVETALRNLASGAGFSDTMRLILRMETKLVEDNRELFEEKTVSDWTLRLEVDENGRAEILCFRDGKPLKSVASKIRKDPYVLRLQEMKKQLTEQYRRTRRMLEQAMEDGTPFLLRELEQLTGNPVAKPILEKLIFRLEEKLGLFRNGALVALDGTVLADEPGAMVEVAHPFHLFRSGLWPLFQKHLFENRIAQPFRQVFRELYVKTDEEMRGIHSMRYAGHQIQPKKAAACLKERRWIADIDAGLQKVYYRENLVATIYALADWFTPADIEAPTLEYVAFFHRKTGKPIPVAEVPDVIFSEVMRDVDLAVSVAHVGGVDPETSHSTVEMRAAILECMLPLLRLENVHISGHHAHIGGTLGEYTVHLGSGVVHQVGGTMLNVLPVHAQHRGRIFLPFVDDDPQTAEIISKVILFSEDRKLKDPGILSQIRR